MKKILVFGCPGSGKSELAKKLGIITGFEVYHIEDDSSIKGDEEKNKNWLEAIEKITKKNQWIIEGTQLISYDIRIKNANSIIFINMNRLKCLMNYIKRCIKYSDMHFSWNTIKKILIFKKEIKPFLEKLIKDHSNHLIVYRINSKEEVDEFIQNMRKVYK